jgi:excisionase family DNA binding protein
VEVPPEQSASRSDRTPPTSPVLFTLGEAAKACRVSRSTIRRALESGKFPAAEKDAGGVWRLTVADLLVAGFTPHRAEPTSPPPSEPSEVEQLKRENATLRERVARAEAQAEERWRHLDTALAALRALEASNIQQREIPGEFEGSRWRRWWRRAR